MADKPHSRTGSSLSRGNIILLMLSFLLAFVTWLAHNLTQDYMVYLQYRVRVTTNLEGYAPQAVSEEELVLGGQAAGFYILGRRGGRGKELEIRADARFFEADPTRPNTFLLDLSKFRDQLDDAVGTSFDVNYIPTTPLSFEFAPQSYKKVPVVSRLTVACKPQYMETAPLELTPDSALVYGNLAELEAVTAVTTQSKELSRVDKSLRGYVALEVSRGLRVEPASVAYSASVARYVEHRFTVDLSTVNVPSDKQLILLPSKLEVTCRIPFGAEISPLRASGAFVVDYNDFLGSRSALVAPKPAGSIARTLFSYSCEPRFVECILSDNRTE